MRVIALDHGSKRVGIAIGDPLGIIAQPLEFIPAEPLDAFFTRLKLILTEKEVGQIIVGMPRNMDGSYGPAADMVRAFVEQLKEEVDLPIRLWDERLTTAQAQRVLLEGNIRRKDRKQRVDKMAAAILLQSYLDAVSG